MHNSHCLLVPVTTHESIRIVFNKAINQSVNKVQQTGCITLVLFYQLAFWASLSPISLANDVM